MGCPLNCPLSFPLYPYMKVVGSLICMAELPWAAHFAAHWAANLFHILDVVGCLLSCSPSCPLFPYMGVVGSLICMAKFIPMGSPRAAKWAAPLFLSVFVVLFRFHALTLKTNLSRDWNVYTGQYEITCYIVGKRYSKIPRFTVCGKQRRPVLFCSGMLQAEISCLVSAKHISWHSSRFDGIQVIQQGRVYVLTRVATPVVDPTCVRTISLKMG